MIPKNRQDPDPSVTEATTRGKVNYKYQTVKHFSLSGIFKGQVRAIALQKFRYWFESELFAPKFRLEMGWVSQYKGQTEQSTDSQRRLGTFSGDFALRDSYHNITPSWLKNVLIGG